MTLQAYDIAVTTMRVRQRSLLVSYPDAMPALVDFAVCQLGPNPSKQQTLDVIKGVFEMVEGAQR